jgi:hypothetical protein
MFDDNERAMEFALYALKEMNILPINYNAQIERYIFEKDDWKVESYIVIFFPAINGIPVYSSKGIFCGSNGGLFFRRENSEYLIKMNFNKYGIVYMDYNWVEVALSKDSITPAANTADSAKANQISVLRTIQNNNPEYNTYPIFLTDDYLLLKKFYDIRETYFDRFPYSSKQYSKYIADAETGEIIE